MVLGLFVVDDRSSVAVVAVHIVADMLGPAVRESHGVGALGVASAIAGLGRVEIKVGEVISHGVGVGVGGDLISIGLGLVGRGGMVGRGRLVVNNRSRSGRLGQPGRPGQSGRLGQPGRPG